MSRRIPAAAAALAAALLWAGCGGGGAELTRSPSAYGAPTAEQALRTFMDAAAKGEYPTMGRMFGTRQGPAEARLGVTEVEQRMVVIAGLMNFESYRVEPSRLTEPEPDTRRFNVVLEGTGRGTVRVPVFTVRSESGRWFVERLETDALTGSGSR